MALARRAARIALLSAAGVLVFSATCLGITRAEILARAKHWVDEEVPYSQTSHYEGYRTDCSGMASMAWRLPMSYSTRTLRASGYLVQVHRDQIQPGDMLLKYDYHAAIFYRWADADHTWYWTLEQSGGEGHAVSRLTPYPYWGMSGFAAYRPTHVEEVNDYGPYIRPVAGPDRYATAVAASQAVTSSVTATDVIICSGENWPDALGASSLAGVLDAPVLLVPKDRLPNVVRHEIERLRARRATVIGGPGAVSEDVAEAIDALPGVSVRRIGGRNRFETAAMVASATANAMESVGREYDGAFYLATGFDFPDALGAAPVSAFTGRPILLSEPATIPPVTARAIQSLEATMAYVTGGPKALSTTVTAGLWDLGVAGVQRLYGPDRYTTAIKLARHGSEEGLAWDDVAIASGESFPDALAGGVMQGRIGSPLVLTPKDRLCTSADWAVREHLDTVERVTVFGGEKAVEPIVRRLVRWIMDEP